MRVNKFTIRVPEAGVTANTITVPISLDFSSTDQAEVVERDFVNKEINKAINLVFDAEKARFIPTDQNGDQIKQLTYSINLLSGSTFPTTTTYLTAGFEQDDIKFRKNKFKRSFLRLRFYDTDIPTNQNQVSFMTLFSRLTVNDIVPLVSTLGAPITGGGLPNPVGQIPLRFMLEDPIINPEGISEGYHLYHFKDEVSSTLPKELFMRSSWDSAKTGKSIPLITDSIPQTIDNLVNKLHMRYILKRDNSRWFYEIDMTYSSPTNITTVGDIQTVQLYQIQAL